MEDIIENNILIAEFIGGYYPYEFDDFDISWDALMPVIQKICSMDRELFNSGTHRMFERVISLPINTPIIKAYETVVNFLNWYNSQQTQG